MALTTATARPSALPPITTDTTSAPDGDGLRAPTPIEVVNGAGGVGSDGASAEASPAVAGDVPTSEMRMAQWIAEFVIGDGMPALPTNDVGYVFDTSVPVSRGPGGIDCHGARRLIGEPVRIDDGFKA